MNVPTTLLLIDDEPGNLDMLMFYLKDYGFNILTALNGREGMESARRDCPALILLDIQMPRMDGFEVCEKLKADEQTRHIPVIFASRSGRG